MPELIDLTLHLPEARALLRVREAGAERAHELREKAFERLEAAAALLLGPAKRLLPEGEAVRTLSLRAGHRALRLGLPGGERELAGAELAGVPEAAWAGLWGVALREAGYPQADAAAALMSEREFWAARYREQDTGWDLGQAAPPLLRAFQGLPPGRAVVVGCGRGHEVRALAALGHRAVGVDFAAEAVEEARRASAGSAAEFVQADLFTLPGPLGTFDYWVEHTCFCAIDPGRRAEYVAVAHRTLRPGGRLIGLFYAHGRPGGPPFTTTEAEVRTLFRGFAVESLERAPDSHERRRNEELLAVLRRE